MGYYDPIRKVAIRNDGSIAYATGFGTVTTIEPFTKEVNKVTELTSLLAGGYSYHSSYCRN